VVFLKRAVDIAVSAAALVLLSPLFAVLVLAILLDSGHPMFYSQWRVGRGFRRFWLYKFRSMKAGEAGPSITVSGDDRITRIGKFLRATKLDELPQFWNVLRGDMSLVGPRPEVPEYVEQFKARYERILAIRPGITDLASIRFRNEEELLAASPEPLREYVERVLPLKLDLADEYLQTASFFRDLSILVQTVVVTVWKQQ
jgi:lipopolysaccharide/colanic/teichoic acid biosynthesis glycosyltransferase